MDKNRFLLNFKRLLLVSKHYLAVCGFILLTFALKDVETLHQGAPELQLAEQHVNFKEMLDEIISESINHSSWQRLLFI